ncbi:hypothetical protein P3X46_016836 [Hevea brasiliensis]|uniref:DUF7890 domain-containing protein n=1 Tax=Hevea brasiliensis TaxID=3981 RepID=A0ABQ9M0K5_HEVBR|nr:hypothetical protein P3X46_016835 [Hevea brasiliensis]KAJ9173727.1 hypothetical protein P3X46_016836 [Hevea brasiliensis]
MWSSLNASFNRVVLRGPKGTNFIHRDDLSKNPSTKKVKKGDFLASSREPLLCKELEDKKNLEKRGYGCATTVEEKGVIRVKVKMTKQEAARLMSKCKDGGILEFRDVAHELVQIPVNHVSVVSSSCCGYGCSVLKTIPEEI